VVKITTVLERFDSWFTAWWFLGIYN